MVSKETIFLYGGVTVEGMRKNTERPELLYTHTHKHVCVYSAHKCQGPLLTAKQTDDRDV